MTIQASNLGDCGSQCRDKIWKEKQVQLYGLGDDVLNFDCVELRYLRDGGRWFVSS